MTFHDSTLFVSRALCWLLRHHQLSDHLVELIGLPYQFQLQCSSSILSRVSCCSGLPLSISDLFGSLVVRLLS